MNYLFKNEIVDYDFFNNHKSDTIIFLHGWGGNKFSFIKTIELCKSNYNTLLITIPTTQPTISIWNMFDYVDLIENIIKTHSISNPIIVCHSFGCRITMLLAKRINIKKVVITGGAGIKKNLNFFEKITKKNSKILLKNEKFKHLYKFIASNDYKMLTDINKKTFQNVVNLNLNFASVLNCPTTLFWGKQDKETPVWIAKKLRHLNNSELSLVKSDHFAYSKESAKFNHLLLDFIKN